MLPGWRGRGSWQLFVRLTSNQPLNCIGTLLRKDGTLATVYMTSFRGYLRLPVRLSSATTLEPSTVALRRADMCFVAMPSPTGSEQLAHERPPNVPIRAD